MTTNLIDNILAIVQQKNIFRTKYDYDGYIQISFIEEDKYEVKIESVSFFDQPTANFYYFNKQKLRNYINQNYTKIDK